MLKITVGFSNSVFATQMEEVYVTADVSKYFLIKLL